MMNEQEIIRRAEEAGFAAAVFVDTDRIEFQPAFRPLCKENVCGKYGVNYACPPDCGTVKEMAARIRRYRRALVLQTMWEIADPLSDETKPAKRRHNRMTQALRERLDVPCLMVGAGGCDLCAPCALPAGEPCRFPDKRFSCLSAYCIFARALCEKCGLDYDCGPGLVAFFSLLCF